MKLVCLDFYLRTVGNRDTNLREQLYAYFFLLMKYLFWCQWITYCYIYMHTVCINLGMEVEYNIADDESNVIYLYMHSVNYIRCLSCCWILIKLLMLV